VRVCVCVCARMCVSATHLFVCVTCFVSQVLDQFGVRKSVGYTGQQVGVFSRLCVRACVVVFVCACMYSQRIRTFSSVVTAWASAYSPPPTLHPLPASTPSLYIITCRHHVSSSRVIITCHHHVSSSRAASDTCGPPWTRMSASGRRTCARATA